MPRGCRPARRGFRPGSGRRRAARRRARPGTPVALETRADEREARGLIPITTTRPVRGRGRTGCWSRRSSRSLRRCDRRRPGAACGGTGRSSSIGRTQQLSPVWTPMASTFSMKPTVIIRLLGVPDDLQLELLPADQRFLDQDLVDQARGQPAAGGHPELLGVVHQAAACAPDRCRPGRITTGIAQLGRHPFGFLHAGHGPGWRACRCPAGSSFP